MVYPNKWWRKFDRVVDLTSFDLTGDLDVSDFGDGYYGNKIILNGNPNLGEIIDRKREKTEIILSRPQEFLNYWYPINGTCLRKNEKKEKIDNYGKRREEIEELDIHYQKLTGSLELVSFGNLVELDCHSNQLTDLILPAENKIERLDCSNNPYLKSDFLLALHPEQMTNLYLDTNLETQLKVHLREGERIGKYENGAVKYTSELFLNEHNYATLLTRWQKAQQQLNDTLNQTTFLQTQIQFSEQ